MSGVVRVERRIPIAGFTEPGGAGASIAVRIICPEAGLAVARSTVLFCFPGGGMTKDYFDLDASDDLSFNFAEAMAQRGFLTVAMDHLGVGASTRPEDGYRLHPEIVASAGAEAVAEVKRLLRDGLDGYAPLGAFSAIGVGHSMGAMLTTWMQAHHKPFDGVVILGAGPYGLPEHLPSRLKPLAGKPQRARDEIAAIMRAASMEPYARVAPNPQARRLLASGNETGSRALARARGELITVCGMFSMIPGSWAPEAAQIRDPALLVYGDRDLGDWRAGRGYFPGAGDLSCVLLPETGHNHFVFEARGRLFDEVARWVEARASTLPAV